MNLIKTIDQYNEDCVYFCEPIKNTIMNEGNFIRIIYSNSYFMLNGIYLSIDINKMTIEKYYNKYKCSFNVSSHRDIIETLKIIEDNILKRSGIKNKLPHYKILEQFINGNIKILPLLFTIDTVFPLEGFINCPRGLIINLLLTISIFFDSSANLGANVSVTNFCNSVLYTFAAFVIAVCIWST